MIQGGEDIGCKINSEGAKDRKLQLDLEVLFEDDFLAVINKPAGILVSGNKFLTVANALAQNLKPSNQLDALQPQPIHRLDYATSGVLLVGKTSQSIQKLGELFSSREIEKTYYAITIGSQKNNGEVHTPIDDKPASSEFQVMDSVDSLRFGKLNLVKLYPKTGRRHQLRKHQFEIGNPILGDKEYGIEGLIHQGNGLYLHAYSLDFTHPFTNYKILINKALPPKFTRIFPAEIE